MVWSFGCRVEVLGSGSAECYDEVCGKDMARGFSIPGFDGLRFGVENSCLRLWGFTVWDIGCRV